MEKRDLAEVILEIKNEIPGFKRDELLEYTKWAIPQIYNSLKDKEEPKIKCKPELINKLNEERDKYRINNTMDHISVQYIELHDTIKKDDEFFVQVYLSIYFYDDVRNNIGENLTNDKYWNDIWIVTYKSGIEVNRKNSNCVNCGAIMDYSKVQDVFKCEYCGNTICNKTNIEWEIVDIELGN